LTGTDLEFEFTKKPDCAASSKWLMFHDHDTKLTCVGIGGPTNYPGIYLSSPMFSHGLLYVAISRVTSRDGLKMLITDENGEDTNMTSIVVYRDVFYNVR